MRPSPAIFTFTSRPTNWTQWRCQRTGRSIPGLDTSKTYRLPRGPLASSHCSRPRLTRLQSSTVTFRGGQSMRTWTSGRFGVPPMRRSAKSNPNASSRVRKASTRLSVSMKKKRGPNFARITVGNVAGGPSMSTERLAEVRDHAAVAALRRPMREEPIAPLGAAPGGCRDFLDAEVPRVAREDGAEVELDGAGESKAHCDLRANFITATANAYATMHYDVARLGNAAPLQQLDALLQNAVRGAPPAGVHQRDRALVGDGQIHRNAVGDRDRQQHARLFGRVTVEPVEDQPTVRPGLVPAHVRAVHLMRQDDRRKSCAEARAERAPAADHLPHRLVAPEAETQRACRDAGDQSVALGPLCQLQAWHGGIAGWDFRERSYGRSMLRPYLMFGVQSALRVPATGRRCARSRVRSVRCSGSPSRPGRRAPRAASPSRRECRDSRRLARAARTARQSPRGADRTAQCARPCRSICRQRTGAIRTTSRTRAAIPHIGSRRRSRWT